MSDFKEKTLDFIDNIPEYVDKIYNEIENDYNKLDLPSNILTTVIIGILLLWIVLGFSRTITILFLFITNIVCLYYLYKSKYIKLKT